MLLERDASGQGASIRNFGMIWPIGQPLGELFELALRSRQLWVELAAEAGVWMRPCGSLHLARQSDEWEVLAQFVDHFNQSDLASRVAGMELGPLSNDPVVAYQDRVCLVEPAQVAKLSPAARQSGLLGAMWSPLELGVSPRQAVGCLTKWLASRSGVDLRTRTQVIDVGDGSLRTSAGEAIEYREAVICSGSDFETLFPESYRLAGLRKCKLQMMSTTRQPAGFQLGPHLAGGLTLRHYRSFEVCPSLPKLQQRIAAESPELDRYGIHVMASQNDAGEVILGDSHEYDDAITPFDSTEIEQLMLAELDKLLELPDFRIQRRWHGVYAKHPEQHVWVERPVEGVRLVTATGGAGMTLSLALAEQTMLELAERLES